ECVSETPSAEPERFALICQSDHDLSFILRVSCPVYQPGRFKPLEQRRRRARFKGQLFGDSADGLTIIAPEHVEDEILGIGQPQFIENRLVKPLDGDTGRVDGIAELVIEWHGDIGCFVGHGGSSSLYIAM